MKLWCTRPLNHTARLIKPHRITPVTTPANPARVVVTSRVAPHRVRRHAPAKGHPRPVPLALRGFPVRVPHRALASRRLANQGQRRVPRSGCPNSAAGLNPTFRVRAQVSGTFRHP